MALEKFKTSDGIDVIVERVPGMRNVNVDLIVMVGSVDEPDDLAGICHALEHCVHLRTPSFKGTPSIDHFANRNAFYRNADTYYTRTHYYAEGLNVEPMFKLISELVLHAEFVEDEVAAELKSVRREARTRLDNIESLHHICCDYVLFGKPYGREIVGYHDKIHFSAATLKDFYERHYTPDNMALVVVGDIDIQRVSELAEHYLSSDRRLVLGGTKRLEPARPHPSVTSYGFVRNDSNNAIVSLESVAPKDYIRRDDENEWAYSAARGVVTQAVFEHLRHDLGLSYDGSFITAAYNHRDAWLHRAEVMVDTDQVDKAITGMKEVLSRDHTSYSDELLEESLVKQSMNAAIDVDDILSRANTYVDMIAYESPLRSVEEGFDRLKQTTLDDVRRALKDMLASWQSANHIECVTGPKEAVGDRFVIEQSIFT